MTMIYLVVSGQRSETVEAGSEREACEVFLRGWTDELLGEVIDVWNGEESVYFSTRAVLGNLEKVW